MTSFYTLILEAALRGMIAAAAVWAGFRILRISNVLVLKAAWALVLLAALALPLAPHWPSLPGWTALQLPEMPALSALRQWTTANSSKPVIQPAVRATLQPQSTAVESYADRYPAPAISDSHFESSADAPGSQDAAAAPLTAFDAVVPQTILKAPASAASLPVSAHGVETSASNRIPLRVAGVCLLVYAAVTLALLLRLLLGLASAVRLWMTARPVSFVSDHALMASIPVRSSSRVASPVNIGSSIVLPADHTQWDEETLRVVLAHERSHIRQGDFYLQLIAGVYTSLFWFSPLGWWLKRKLYELGEAISDRAGLEEAASRASYAQLLLEFAALPRPTLTGVAMARTSHLSQRIERLLNESSFRQAFAAGGRRAILAVILVPAALLAATAFVRVQAAPLKQDQPAAVTGQSTPEQVIESTPPLPPTAAPAPVPAPSASPEPAPAPPPPPAAAAMPAPPDAPIDIEMGPIMVHPHVRVNPQVAAIAPMPPMPPNSIHFNPRDFAFAYGFGQDGESYAVVGEDGKVRHMNHWFIHDGSYDSQSEIEKARKQAHGPFLWFQHDGKSYIIDDPAVLSQIEAMNKPMDDLQVQMKDLGKQMRAFGDQQREKSHQMRETAIQTPDLSKELAAIKAAEASLQAKQGGTISQKDLADLQRQIGKMQGELGALQGKIAMQQTDIGKAMSEFGAQQGKLGSEMGKLGSEMGRIARENQSKMKDIINNSLSSGKAKEVK